MSASQPEIGEWRLLRELLVQLFLDLSPELRYSRGMPSLSSSCPVFLSLSYSLSLFPHCPPSPLILPLWCFHPHLSLTSPHLTSVSCFLPSPHFFPSSPLHDGSVIDSSSCCTLSDRQKKQMSDQRSSLISSCVVALNINSVPVCLCVCISVRVCVCLCVSRA